MIACLTQFITIEGNFIRKIPVGVANTLSTDVNVKLLTSELVMIVNICRYYDERTVSVKC